MLQAALGGYYILSDNYNYMDDSPDYYEPGYNIMYPLEIEVPASDKVYILIRRRNPIPNSFASISASNFFVSVKDPTNGEPISSLLSSNSLHSAWNSTSPSYSPLVLQIDIAVGMSTIRARTLDCYIKDTSDNCSILFRISVLDEGKNFAYIPVVMSRLSDRPNASAFSRDVRIQMRNESDLYILVSPYAYLTEVDRNDKYDFSYPLDSIYYKRQNTYNNEDFEFSIGEIEDDFVTDNVSIMNVPGYGKVAVAHVDQYFYTKVVEKGSGSYFYINITGRVSGIEDSLKITLYA